MSKNDGFVIETDQENDLVVLRDYMGKDEAVRIPDSVTAIGTGAFSGIRHASQDRSLELFRADDTGIR